MKKIFLLSVLTIVAEITFSQTRLKQLKVFCTNGFDPNVTVTVPHIRRDRCQAVYLLKNALAENGFKVIDENVADAEIQQPGAPRIYSLRFTYNYKSDAKCAPYALQDMTGQVIDLLNEGTVVATFSFRQGEWSFGSKCTQEIMKALAAALKTKTNNN
ncbi:hypothetical protein [Parafilimonas sp.]|uniref:hypothetical protein n=1 Tax=Parafilimonas sp. TaxID=1969739 RepID=UPI0039E70083